MFAKIITFITIFTIFGLLPVSANAAKKIQPQREPEPVAEPEQAYPPIDEMLGSMIMLGFRGDTLAENDPFLALVKEGKVGNVLLFDRDVTVKGPRNIISPEQVKKLTETLQTAARHPMFIAVDQEGGQVRRLKPRHGFMDLPSAQSMGQGNIHETLRTATALGEEMHNAGINVDLAPVVDVDTNPLNPGIGKLGRAFNTDAKIVAAHALAFGQGLAKSGIVPVLKHFPGQGCAGEDTHLSATNISQCWKPEIDLLPYAEIFAAGWPGMVLIGHLFHPGLDPELPATLSKNVIDGLLRGEMGWQGVVITDDMQMKAVTEGRDLKENIRLAVEAGNDILLFGNNIEWDPDLPQKVFGSLRSLFDEGKISKERVIQSWRRISALHDIYAQLSSQPHTQQ